MSDDITTRRWKTWTRDAGERAVRTYAQATVAALPIIGELTIEGFFTWEPHSIGLGAAAISVLMSLGAKRTGSPATARING